MTVTSYTLDAYRFINRECRDAEPKDIWIRDFFLKEIAPRLSYAALMPIVFTAAVLDTAIGSVAGLVSLLSAGFLCKKFANEHLRAFSFATAGVANLALNIFNPEASYDRNKMPFFQKAFFIGFQTIEHTAKNISNPITRNIVSRIVPLVAIPELCVLIILDALVSVVCLPVMFLTLGAFPSLNTFVLGGLRFPVFNEIFSLVLTVENPWNYAHELPSA